MDSKFFSLAVAFAAVLGASGCSCDEGSERHGLMCIAVVDGGIPPGEAPYIDSSSVPSILPVGTPSFSLTGGRFAQNSSALVTELVLRDSGKTISAQVTVVDEKTINITPTWQPGIVAGLATIVVRNDKGAAMQTVNLGRFGFKNTSTSTESLTQPKWIKQGSRGATDILYVFDSTSVAPFPYTGGSIGAMIVPSLFSGLNPSAVATGRFHQSSVSDNNTDFVLVNGAGTKSINYATYSSFIPTGAGVFTSPWMTDNLSNISAGLYTPTKTVIGTITTTNPQLFYCYVDISASTAAESKCELGGISSGPSAGMWVNTFSTVAGANGDILSIDVGGKLNLWRAPANVFTNQTQNVFDQTALNTSFHAVAVDNVDGKLGDDIVGIDGQTIYSLINTGMGTFISTKSVFSALPQIKSAILGDLTGDGKPDLVLAEAATGKILILANLTDSTGKVAWSPPGPAYDSSDVQISLGAKGVFILDGTSGSTKRKLVIAAQKLTVWDNNVTP